jgi:primosomal protein N' (replication factor Y) (superfamily II helicase)
MTATTIADVALRATLKHGASAVFSYRVPPHLRPLVVPGQLVWAPLRRKRVQGVVLALRAGQSPEPSGLRELIGLADPEALLTPAGIALAQWVSATYRVPLAEALALLLPPGTTQDAQPTWRASQTGMAAELGTLPERERAVLYYLRTHGESSEKQLRASLLGSDADLRKLYVALRERGLILEGSTISGARARPRKERIARLLVPSDQIDIIIEQLARAPRQQAVVRWLGATLTPTLYQGEGWDEGNNDQFTPSVIPVTAIYAATGADSALLKQLETKGLIEIGSREVRRDPLAGDGVPPDQPPPLTPQQQRALAAISGALEGTGGRGQEAGGRGQEAGGRGQEAGLYVEGTAEEMRTWLLPPASERSERPASERSERPASERSERPASERSERPASERSERPASCLLLHGVTGSGKTEVYLRAIARVLRLGKQALVLVPEIALTTQLVRRFAARFPNQLAVLHSGLSLGERYDEWRRLRRGEARVAIGSRSAVFAPLPELGLIIVDEEHELTYKHDGSPRYHARDAALQLGQIAGCPVVLGSATPSVESYTAAQEGRYQLIDMPQRVGGGIGVDGLPRSAPLPLPPVRLIDMRRELQRGNRSIFSNQLHQALDQVLERGEQAILFLNRRGAASFVLCRDCGHVVSCPACSGPLTVHYDEQDSRVGARSDPTILLCHSCGYNELMPTFCPNCLSTRIKAFGIGTQRVEEEVLRLFPAARVLRWDRDSVSGKGAHGRMLDIMVDGKADVLVGTQMIAKGLDLPMVSLVGVISADTGLHLPDFRSGERAFQLLTQVAGRAGRRSGGAQVLIQTYNPEHYALQAAQEHDYKTFYAEEIAFRRETGYPPYGRLVRFIYSSGSEQGCEREAKGLARRLNELLERRKLNDWGVIGPAPCFIRRTRGRWRWHLLLRIPLPQAETIRIARVLDELEPLYNWIVDVDPAHVL